MSKLYSLLKDFSNALLRLDEVLTLKKTDIVRDSAIQRFEIVYDLAWKTLKTFLEDYHNVLSCNSPRNCFKEAIRLQLMEYDPFWIKIIAVRNFTAHIYSENLAEKAYIELPNALIHFKKLCENIKNQMMDVENLKDE